MNDNYISSQNPLRTYEYKNSFLNQKCSFKEYDNATILPVYKEKGGVIDKYGNFIDSSIHDSYWCPFGGFYPYNSYDVDYLNEDIIFLGYFDKQWGHFIIEHIERLWITNIMANANYKYVFLPVNNDKLNGNYQELLTLAGIEHNKLIEIKKPTKFRNILIPDAALNKDKGFNHDYQELIARIINNTSITKQYIDKKIYLSRTYFKEAQRKEIGESKIENIFRKNGFLILYPEKMTLQEQISVFQTAKQIVCINGSIPLNAVFAPKNINLIVLNKTSLLHIDLIEACAVSGIEPLYIDVFFEPIPGHPRYLGEGPFWVKTTDYFINYLKHEHYQFSFEKDNTFINMIKYSMMYLKYRLLKEYYLYFRHKISTLLKKARKANLH